jgi:hypothetical protein
MIHDDTATNAGVSLTSGIPAYVMFYIQQTDLALFATLALPVVFFIIGQGFVWIRWYFDRQKKKDE